jgi:hypothetical protein
MKHREVIIKFCHRIWEHFNGCIRLGLNKIFDTKTVDINYGG